MAKAVGVEFEVDITTIGVYTNLPNVYKKNVFYLYSAITINYRGLNYATTPGVESP